MQRSSDVFSCAGPRFNRVLSRLLFLTAAAGSFLLHAPRQLEAATFTSLSAWAAAAGPRTTIDFEDFSAGTVITNQYAGRTPAGVVFASPPGVGIADAASITTQVGGSPVSGSRALDVLGNSVDPLTAQFVQTNTATNTSVRAAGGWMLDIGTFAGAIVRFYDLGGNVVDSLTIVPQFESNVFFGAVNPAGISRVVFDGVDAGEYVLIDDFVFANVPEPHSCGLIVLSSFAAIGLFARNRR